MSDNGSNQSRRSSSQTSHASTEIKKPKTLRGVPKRHGSKTSTKSAELEDPALTSFPSFSPEPDVKAASKSGQEVAAKPARTISQKARDRKVTLAGLTNASPSFNKQNALFDDSPRSSLDIPGSLHLGSDEHIERLIARAGAVKLVRQYAADLAQRDAEISALRVRADNRERELKKLLREVNVSTADVEKRLLRLEQGPGALGFLKSGQATDRVVSATSLDGMMNEAMADGLVTDSPVEGFPVFDPNTGLPNSKSPSQFETQSNRSRTGSQEINQPKGSGTPSRANSVLSESSQDMDATIRPRGSASTSNKPSALQNIFQAPSQSSSSYFIGGKPGKKPKLGDEASVRSNQSGRSFASWTQIFSGRSQNARSRASSLGQDAAPAPAANEAEVPSAPLSKMKANPLQAATKSTQSLPATANQKGRPVNKRTSTASRLSASPNHARKDSNASSLPPTVELDSMIESSQLPPTMTTHNNGTSGLLTDRFGFIYDQKRRRRQALQMRQNKKNKISGAETIASFRSGESPQGDGLLTERPLTPASIDEEAPKKSWQDYLKVSSTVNPGRPKELLSHTPSAGAVVTVNTFDAEGTITPPRHRELSVSISASKALPSLSGVTEPQSSTVNVTTGDFTPDSDTDNPNDAGPAKLLLEQLTELHDALQAERDVRWNDFLRRVRAERANNVDRATNNTPEAELLNGELIGIATLGRSTKTKNKYLHFKSLVLAGIPVSLRPKIWAECSGATGLRNPGYYEDLVARSQDGSDVDPDIASQIKADVRRTLTDNVFFRQGPGVQRLEELLRAYSLHNPRIGYCQGKKPLKQRIV